MAWNYADENHGVGEELRGFDGGCLLGERSLCHEFGGGEAVLR